VKDVRAERAKMMLKVSRVKLLRLVYWVTFFSPLFLRWVVRTLVSVYLPKYCENLVRFKYPRNIFWKSGWVWGDELRWGQWKSM
jgi:hypothetical protein